MIFQLEIQDDDLAFLDRAIGTKYSALLDRYSTIDSESYGRLLALHIIETHKYYGEQMCYHPRFSPTEIGKLALAQYRKEISTE